MLPFRFVYHEGYDLNLGPHVFPAQKYRLIRERLMGEGLAQEEDFVAPSPSSEEELGLVHSAEWIRKLATGALTESDLVRLEIPCSPRTVEAFRLAAGGTTLAGRLALQHGISFNIGGGFQHAFHTHGEGFCAINDVAIAVRTLQREGSIKTAMVVDCDVHHGNGTAAIFSGDDSVFTVSLHQLDIYPSWKPRSDADVHLPNGTDDAEYCAALDSELRRAFARFRPDLLVYVAGADPYYQDRLGGLTLTFAGLWRRDWLVMETALRHGAPVAVTLGGGYAIHVQDTVTIHVNTAKVASELLGKTGWRLH
jgi:acetoin utilization deacetylase AcuC-like enzyme